MNIKVWTFMVILAAWLISLIKSNITASEFVKQCIILIILTSVMFGD